MGFTQGRERENGFERLWDTVLRKYASPSECVVYAPETWKIDARRRMQQLQRLEMRHLFIIAYSHGQAAAMAMARMAPRYDIWTVRMCLLDPVGRNPVLPRWAWAQTLSARSITPWMRIKIPPTVSRVAWARQYRNLPRAHDLEWDKRHTYVADPLVLDATHSEAQWHPEWFAMVDREVDNWRNPPQPVIIPES